MHEENSPMWLSKIRLRSGTREDLLSLEWNGELIHFRRLFYQIYQSACQGRAMIWVADILRIGVIGQLFVQIKSHQKEVADRVQRAYIYGFRIKPEYRGYGVGSQLLCTAEGNLIDKEYRWITLNVSQQNLTALRFYERHGYKVIGEDPGRWTYMDHLGDQREVCEPAWRMEKRII